MARRLRLFLGTSNSEFIMLLYLLIVSSLDSISASGLWMNALRNRLNPGLKSNTILIAESFPPIQENPHLDKIDEEYSKCNGIDIRELTVLEIQELFALGKLTSVKLTKCYIQRIKKTNEALRSVNELNPDAIIQAEKADLERKYGKPDRDLLHGIPILIKENIGTRDKMETTAGALALVGSHTMDDAGIVKALRKAGAVILGKANLSEFAFFRGTNIPSGWSGRGGQTRNAYNLNVPPDGSSSGSAVAVSANLAVVSVGTETDGSLIAPANAAGLCTIKPTHVTPSVEGILPLSHTQDNAGPMARTVTDLAILLDAMIPESERNPKQPASFTQSILNNENPRPFRIGVMRHPFFNTSAINSENLRSTLPQLDELILGLKNSLQFDVLDPLSPEITLLTSVSGEKEFIVLLHDFKHDLNEYLRTQIVRPLSSHVPGSRANDTSSPSDPAAAKTIKSLADVIEYNDEHPSPEGYNQDILIMAEATDGLENMTYIKARKENRDSARLVLDSMLEKYDLDAVVAPSNNAIQGVFDEELFDAPIVGYNLGAISGYPSANIPVGIGLKGVPFGITFTGRPYSEDTLLKIMYAVEKLFPRRQAPKFML